MKNRLLLFTFVMIALCACKTNSYTIKGHTADPRMEGLTVRMFDRGSGQVIDSAVVVNGKYTFKGTVEAPAVYILTAMSPEKCLLMTDLIIDNAVIHIDSDENSYAKVSGTPDNDLLRAYQERVEPTRKKLTGIYNQFFEIDQDSPAAIAQEDSLSALYDTYANEEMTMLKAFVKENINNLAGQSQLNRLMSMPAEDSEDLLVNATPATLALPAVKALTDRIAALKTCAIGQPYIDLHMKDPNGKDVSLSDYVGKGKYVLVDFWASWCGPCRDEIPNLIKAYEKYKNMGFEVVGVSFDSKEDAWKKGLADLKMPWPQMSNLDGFGAAGKAYAITGIPHTVLIDKNGIIIEKDLWGEYPKLQEIFGK